MLDDRLALLDEDFQEMTARQLTLFEISALTSPSGIMSAYSKRLAILKHQSSILSYFCDLKMHNLCILRGEMGEYALREEKPKSFYLWPLEYCLILEEFRLKLFTLEEKASRASNQVLEGSHIVLLASLDSLDECMEGLVDGRR